MILDFSINQDTVMSHQLQYPAGVAWLARVFQAGGDRPHFCMGPKKAPGKSRGLFQT
jgi:hypothetical protein